MISGSGRDIALSIVVLIKFLRFLGEKIAAQSFFDSFRQIVIDQIINFFQKIVTRNKNLFEKWQVLRNNRELLF